MKRINWQSLGILSVLVTLAAVLYGSYRSLHDVDFNLPTLFRQPAGKRALITMEGFRFAQTEDGRVAWRITANSADLLERREALLKNIEIVFTTPDEKQATLTGDYGTMDTLTGNAMLHHGNRDVRIVTSDGYLMTTDSLSWSAGERLIRTEDAFKVLGREIYLEGKGLSADVDMQKLVVEGDVKAVLQE